MKLYRHEDSDCYVEASEGADKCILITMGWNSEMDERPFILLTKEQATELAADLTQIIGDIK